MHFNKYLFSILTILVGCAHQLKKAEKLSEFGEYECRSFQIESVRWKESTDDSMLSYDYRLKEDIQALLNQKNSSQDNIHNIKVSIDLIEGHPSVEKQNVCSKNSGIDFIFNIFSCKETTTHNITIKMAFEEDASSSPTVKTISMNYEKTFWFWNLFWNSWETVFSNSVESEIKKTISSVLMNCQNG